MDTTNNTGSTAMAGLGLIMLLFILAVALAAYVLVCYCFKRICEKAGGNPGVLIWIPILQYIPLLQAAGMAAWMIILFLIPLVNIVLFLVVWAKILTAMGKSPWLVILFLVPVVNLGFFLYLAFSGGGAAQAVPSV